MGFSLSGLGNFVGSLLGQDNSPTRQIANLDSDTKGLIDKINARGERSQEEITKEGYGLADESAAQVSQPKQVGGYNPMMGDAIRMKYQEAANKDLGRFRLQSEMQGVADKSQQMKTGWEMLMAKQNVAMENFAKAAEAKMQAEQLRSQVLSSVFQAGGQAIGMGIRYGQNRDRGHAVDQGIPLDEVGNADESIMKYNYPQRVQSPSSGISQSGPYAGAYRGGY